MPEAYIYDAVRTPRGRGKQDGSLHEATSLRLAETALRALKERNDLDTNLVDDVILGCVDPVGEAGLALPLPPPSRPLLRRHAPPLLLSMLLVARPAPRQISAPP